MGTRRVGKLLTEKTMFFECDIQEKFRDLIYYMPAVISNAKFLLDVADELGVPCVATEQYPERLLRTVHELNIGTDVGQIKAAVYSKNEFSMCTEEVMKHLEDEERKPTDTDIVLFGIEAHVCVTQTCLDLLEQNYGVHVVCDAVSSQNPHDRAVALERMKSAGAYLTTAEQVAFQLLGSSKNSKFKAVSALVKKRNREAKNSFSTMTTL